MKAIEGYSVVRLYDIDEGAGEALNYLVLKNELVPVVKVWLQDRDIGLEVVVTDIQLLDTLGEVHLRMADVDCLHKEKHS